MKLFVTIKFVERKNKRLKETFVYKNISSLLAIISAVEEVYNEDNNCEISEITTRVKL